MNYHREDHIVRALRGSGFEIVKQSRIASPSTAAKATTDLVIIGAFQGDSAAQ